MNLSPVALSLLAFSWAPDTTATGSSLRRTSVGLLGTDDDCWKAKSKAADLSQEAMSACGTLVAGAADQVATEKLPSPTCLLLLCRAQQTGSFLIKSSCEGNNITDTGIFDVCPLVPGLLIPDLPKATDDMVILDFDEDARSSITVDVLSNDKFTFGQVLQITRILKKEGPGKCDIVDDQIEYTPDFPKFDSGLITCQYETCYVGRYVDMCAQAVLTIEVTGAPTASPTMAPTQAPTGAPTITDLCDLTLDVIPLPFPPPGFDATTRCTHRPSEMTLKYNGGGCEQSQNKQGPNASDKFRCTDYGGGPTTEGQNYVVVSDLGFHKAVNVSETFSLSYDEHGSWFPSDLAVEIYADMTKDSLLQEIRFHSSCSKALFLSDKFGSVQVFGYKNDPYYQGTQSLIQPFETRIEVTNNSTALNVTVDELYFEFNDVGENIEGISNETLGFGMGLNISTSNNVDTTVSPLVLVYQANVTAVNEDNVTCSAVVNSTVVNTAEVNQAPEVVRRMLR